MSQDRFPPCSRSLLAAAASARADVELLNVSYDPTRELYEEYNALFAKHWKKEHGEDVVVHQSHGGSGKQARAVLDGLEADVVTLALAGDIDALFERGQLVPRTWQERCRTAAARTPRRSCSWCARATRSRSATGTTSCKPGVAVITPNPKTSGGARWNFLAAWGYALRKNGGNEAKARELVGRALQERAGARHGRARLDHHVRRARHRRRADRLGERGAARGRGDRQGRVRGRRALGEHPGRAAGRGGRRGRAAQGQRRASPPPTSSTSTRPRRRS